MRIEATGASVAVAAAEGAQRSRQREEPRRPAPAPELPDVSLPADVSHSVRIQLDDRGRIFYQVINERTGQELMQIPPEQVRRVAQNIAAMMEELARRDIDIVS